MKVICLNTWGGLAGKEELLAFFEKYKNIDIFCLQEMWSAPHSFPKDQLVGGKRYGDLNLMTQGVQEISAILGSHHSFFRPHFNDNFGLLILVKNNLEIVAEGEVYVHKQKGYIPGGDSDVGKHARNIQFVTLATKHGERTVINFHGLWNGQGKDDSDDRLEQSDKITEFVKTLQSPVVLCGDFNLLPETQSLKKIEDLGLKNLIKEFGITSTRSSHYKKPIKFADYTFVDPEIKINEFKILPDEVSDHLAMYLDFE